MKHKYLARLTGIACLCMSSLFIRSEGKLCNSKCSFYAGTPGKLRTIISAQASEEGILPYYGFYGKY